METRETAKQVWQRVQGEPSAPDFRALPEMISEEKSDAAIYLHLSHHFTGKDGAMLRRMFEEEQAHIACLRGIYRMCTGERCSVHTPPPAQEELSVTLRRCYGREMRCLAAYEARSGDGEYGPVFARMAQQEREHCQNILLLMGKLDPR